MSEIAARRMTVDAFLDWQAVQDIRCELVDGRPMAMTGASFAHDLVVGNLAFALRRQLHARSSKCRVFSADIGLVTGPATLRRPDLAVYCPPFERAASKSDQPKLVAEVLSRSTEHVDQFMKLDEYRALSSLNTILILEPERIDVGVWQRVDAVNWHHVRHKGDMDATVTLPDLGFSIAVRDVYDDVVLRPLNSPRLVWPEEVPDR